MSCGYSCRRGVDTALVTNFGFVPARYQTLSGAGFGAGFGGLGWPALVSPVTYMFLHGGWLHLIVNVASLAAFGSAVERPLDGGRRLGRGGAHTMLAVFFLSGIAGAFSQYAAAPDSGEILIGASGGSAACSPTPSSPCSGHTP